MKISIYSEKDNIMDTTNIKRALQEAFGSQVFDDNMVKSVDLRVEQLKKARPELSPEDTYLVAVKDLMGATFSVNVEHQIRQRAKVLDASGSNVPPAPGLGGVKPVEPKIATPFNDDTVGGNAAQEALTDKSLKGDFVGSVNAQQKAAFEANPDANTRGTGGNTPATTPPTPSK